MRFVKSTVVMDIIDICYITFTMFIMSCIAYSIGWCVRYDTESNELNLYNQYADKAETFIDSIYTVYPMHEFESSECADEYYSIREELGLTN